MGALARFMSFATLAVLIGCQSPTIRSMDQPGGQPDQPGTPPPGEPGTPPPGEDVIDPDFDYQVTTNFDHEWGTDRHVSRSILLSFRHDVGLELTLKPTKPDKVIDGISQIDNISAAFAFVRPDGTLVSANYEGKAEATGPLDIGPGPGEVRTSYDFAHLDQDFYKFDTWTRFIQLQVRLSVKHRHASGVYSKTLRFPLDQDAPAMEGTGYRLDVFISLTDENFARVVAAHPEFSPGESWIGTLERNATYPGGLGVETWELPNLGFASLIGIRGFRPADKQLRESWKFKVDATGDGQPDIVWDFGVVGESGDYELLSVFSIDENGNPQTE